MQVFLSQAHTITHSGCAAKVAFMATRPLCTMPLCHVGKVTVFPHGMVWINFALMYPKAHCDAEMIADPRIDLLTNTIFKKFLAPWTV